MTHNSSLCGTCWFLETGKQNKGPLTLEYVESHIYLKMTNGRLAVDLDLSCEAAMLELTLDGGMMERDDAQRECTDREEFLGQ